MVEARETRSPLLRAWTLATAAVAGLASAGCTMCPDPFDYSGPVPNGSAPQNDFRARSGGILPLGAAPHPWPLIVKGEGQPDEPQPMPTPTGEVVGEVVGEVADRPVAETDGEELRQTVAVVGEAEAEERPGVPADTPPAPAATTPPTQLEPVPTAAAVSPLPIGETPGWRARRR